MFELFTPLLSTALGIGGAYLQRKHERQMFAYGTERLKIENEQERFLTEMQMQAKREETEQELAITEMAGNVAAFAGSIESERDLSNIEWGKSRLGDVANFMRAVTRPGITWYLVIATSLRTRYFYKQTEGFAGTEAMQAAFEQMLANPFDLALTNLTAMVVGWWFGSRGSRTAYKDNFYTRDAG